MPDNYSTCQKDTLYYLLERYTTILEVELQLSEAQVPRMAGKNLGKESLFYITYSLQDLAAWFCTLILSIVILPKGLPKDLAATSARLSPKTFATLHNVTFSFRRCSSATSLLEGVLQSSDVLLGYAA